MLIYKHNLAVYPFIIALIALAFIGLFSYSEYNPMPVRLILDIVFLLTSIFLLFSKCISETRLVQVAFMLALLGSISWMYFWGDGGFLDFFMIYKYYIFVILLASYIGKKVLTHEELLKLFKLFLVLFIVKYTLWMFLGAYPRPGLYGENNFELILLMLLYAGCFARGVTMPHYLSVSLVIIFLLSGSRSALAALVFVYAVLNIRKIDFKLIVSIFFLSIFLMAVAYIFIDRMGDKGVEGIDRLRFFNYFIMDIKSFSMLEIFFGAPPITPMNAITCRALEFYSSLFSFHKYGLCYSVVLHAFNLRIIYDHGIFGLIALFFVLYRMLAISNINFRFRIIFLGIVFLTGLSVSSMNNIFIVGGLMIVIVTSPKEQCSNYSKELS